MRACLRQTFEKKRNQNKRNDSDQSRGTGDRNPRQVAKGESRVSRETGSTPFPAVWLCLCCRLKKSINLIEKEKGGFLTCAITFTSGFCETFTDKVAK